MENRKNPGDVQRTNELRQLLDEIEVPDESLSDISAEYNNGTSYNNPDLRSFTRQNTVSPDQQEDFFSNSVNSTINQHSGYFHRNPVRFEDSQYESDTSYAQSQAFTPQQVSSMMNWSKNNITPAEGLFPLISAPSISIDEELTGSQKLATSHFGNSSLELSGNKRQGKRSGTTIGLPTLELPTYEKASREMVSFSPNHQDNWYLNPNSIKSSANHSSKSFGKKQEEPEDCEYKENIDNLSKLKSQIANYKISLRKEQEMHENTKKELYENSNYIQKLEEEKDTLENKVSDLEEQVKMLQTKYRDPSNLEKLRGRSLECARVEIKQLKSYLTEKEKCIEDLKHALSQKNLMESNSAREKEIEDLTLELSRLQILNNAQSKRIMDHVQKLENSNKVKEQLENELKYWKESWNTKLSSREEKLQETNNLVFEKDTQIQKLQATVSELQQEIQNLAETQNKETEDHNQKNYEIEMLRNQLSDLRGGNISAGDYEAQLQKVKAKYENQVSKLKKDLEYCLKENNSLKTQLEETNSDEHLEDKETISILQKELSSMQTQLSEYKALEKTLQEQAHSISQEREDLVSHYEEEKSQLTEQIDSLENSLFEKNKTVRKLESELQEAKQLAKQYEEEMESLRKARSQAQQLAEHYRNQAEGAFNETKEIKRLKAELQSTNSDLQQERSDSLRHLAQKDDELHELTSSLHSKEKELKNTLETCNQLKLNLQKAQKDYEGLKKLNQELQVELKAKQKEISQMQSKFREQISTQTSFDYSGFKEEIRNQIEQDFKDRLGKQVQQAREECYQELQSQLRLEIQQELQEEFSKKYTQEKEALEDSYRKRLEELSKDYNSRVNGLKQEYESTLEKVETEYSEKLEELQNLNQKNLEEVRNQVHDYQKDLEITQLQKRIKKLESENKYKAQELSDKHDSELNNKLNEIKTYFKQKKETLKKKFQDKETQLIENYEAEKQELQSQLEITRQEAQKHQKNLSSYKSKEKELFSKEEHLQNQIEELERKLDFQVKETREHYESQLSAKEKALNKKLKDSQKTLQEEYETKLQEQQEEFDKLLQQERTRHKELIQLKEQTYKTNSQRTQEELLQSLEEKESEFQEKLQRKEKTLKNQFEKELRLKDSEIEELKEHLENQKQTEITQIKQKHKTKVQELKETHNKAKAQLEDQVKKLNEDLENAFENARKELELTELEKINRERKEWDRKMQQKIKLIENSQTKEIQDKETMLKLEFEQKISEEKKKHTEHFNLKLKKALEDQKQYLEEVKQAELEKKAHEVEIKVRNELQESHITTVNKLENDHYLKIEKLRQEMKKEMQNRLETYKHCPTQKTDGETETKLKMVIEDIRSSQLEKEKKETSRKIFEKQHLQKYIQAQCEAARKAESENLVYFLQKTLRKLSNFQLSDKLPQQVKSEYPQVNTLLFSFLENLQKLWQSDSDKKLKLLKQEQNQIIQKYRNKVSKLENTKKRDHSQVYEPEQFNYTSAVEDLQLLIDAFNAVIEKIQRSPSQATRVTSTHSPKDNYKKLIKELHKTAVKVGWIYSTESTLNTEGSEETIKMKLALEDYKQKLSKCEDDLKRIAEEYKQYMIRTKNWVQQANSEKEDWEKSKEVFRESIKELKDRIFELENTPPVTPEMLSPDETCTLVMSIFKRASSNNLAEQMLSRNPEFLKILKDFLQRSEKKPELPPKHRFSFALPLQQLEKQETVSSARSYNSQTRHKSYFEGPHRSNSSVGRNLSRKPQIPPRFSNQLKPEFNPLQTY